MKRTAREIVAYSLELGTAFTLSAEDAATLILAFEAQRVALSRIVEQADQGNLGEMLLAHIAREGLKAGG